MSKQKEIFSIVFGIIISYGVLYVLYFHVYNVLFDKFLFNAGSEFMTVLVFIWSIVFYGITFLFILFWRKKNEWKQGL